MKSRSPLATAAWIILAVLAGIAFLWLVVIRLISKLGGRGPCPYAVAWLVDNPVRRKYMGRTLDRIGIQPGERVLELGPGPGAFTLPAAERTLPGGSLVAVDIQPQMIAAVERRVRDAGVTNVETHVASAYDLPLAAGSVDRAFMTTVLAEIPDRHRALVELHRVLRPGGSLAVTEEFLDPDYPLARTVIGWAEAGVQAAEAGLAQAQAGKGVVGAQVAVAQAEVRVAQAQVSAAQAGARPEELRVAQAALDKARAAVRQAQTGYDRVGGGSDTPQTLALEQATLDLQMAQADYDRLSAGPRRTDLAPLQSGVQAAQAAEALVRAQAILTDSQIAAAEAAVAQATAARAGTPIAPKRCATSWRPLIWR